MPERPKDIAHDRVVALEAASAVHTGRFKCNNHVGEGELLNPKPVADYSYGGGLSRLRRQLADEELQEHSLKQWRIRFVKYEYFLPRVNIATKGHLQHMAAPRAGRRGLSARSLRPTDSAQVGSRRGRQDPPRSPGGGLLRQVQSRAPMVLAFWAEIRRSNHVCDMGFGPPGLRGELYVNQIVRSLRGHFTNKHSGLSTCCVQQS